MANILWFVFVLLSQGLAADLPPVYDESKMYFVTVSDSECYPTLTECISSIVETNHSQLGQIAVFDLGLTSDQREGLNRMPFVHVYAIEKVNPYLFTKYVIRQDGRKARGWYSWKPVVLKQALDLFPTLLYLDASTKVKQSLELFFAHIREQGYLFINSWCHLDFMTTKRILKKFRLKKKKRAWMLGQVGVEAGFQGLTRALYDPYVYPVYELARDIRNFIDDGTTPKGFGHARHDQTLFSIHARLASYEIKIRPTIELCGHLIEFSDYIGLKALKGKSEENRF